MQDGINSPSHKPTPKQSKRTPPRQTGFSLVKFLIVMTIVGLVANCGVRPKLQQWETTNRVIDSTKQSGKIAAAVVDYYYTNLKLPHSNEELKIPPPTAHQSELLESIEVKRGGVITVRLNEIADHIMQGDSYTMTPYLNEYEKIVWKCEANTLHERYLPKRCG